MQQLYFLIGLALPLQLGTFFFLPFSYLSGIRVDYLAPALYLSDVICTLFLAVYVFTNKKDKIGSFFRPNRIKITFLFLLVVNGLFSFSQGLWFYRVSRFLFLLLFGYAVSKSFSKKTLPPLFWGLMISTGLQLVLCTLQFLQGGSLQGVWYFLGERYLSRSLPSVAQISIAGAQFLRPYGTFSHPNSMAGFYLLLYTLVLNHRLVTNFPLKILFTTMCALLVVLSFSKIAIVCLAIITVWHVYRTYTCTFCKVAATFVWITIAVLFMLTVGDPLSMIKRIDLFEKSFVLFTQRPLTGTGIGSYIIAQQHLPFLYPYSFHQPVHSIFVLALVESGSLLFIMIAYYVFLFLKKHACSPCLFPLIFVIAATGMVDHYWITLQQNNLLIALVCGIIISHEAKKRLLH